MSSNVVAILHQTTSERGNDDIWDDVFQFDAVQAIRENKKKAQTIIAAVSMCVCVCVCKCVGGNDSAMDMVHPTNRIKLLGR